MNKDFTAKGWINDALGYAETFTGDDVCLALDAKSDAERKQMSRNLSYLVETKKIKRLQRGVFSKLSHTKDLSLTLRSAYCENFRTKEEVDERVDAMKINRSPCEFKNIPLWNYKNRTGKLYKIETPGFQAKYQNTEYLLRIDADDVQLKRILRYAISVASGAVLVILIKGIADIRKLLPKLKWF